MPFVKTWTYADDVPMSRAYTYCRAFINGGVNRCNNRCSIYEDFCTSCKASRATPKTNLGNSVSPDGEKGQLHFSAGPSKPVEMTSRESSRRGKLYDAVGALAAEKLIRDARGLKCVNCGEPIGTLSDAVNDYGWVHCPNEKSYTFCYPEQNQIDLKAEPVAEEVSTD